MKWLHLITLLFCIPLWTSAQNDTVFVKYMDLHGEEGVYREDTLFSSQPTENHYLVGTMMLPGTGNRYSGYEYGLTWADVVGSECDNRGGKPEGPDQIVDVNWTDSSLIIDCKIASNCCHDFLCDFEVNEEGILNLTYLGYGEYCACNCCFGLTFTFVVDHYLDEIKEPKGVMINGQESTYQDFDR